MSMPFTDMSEIERLTVEKKQKMQQAREHMKQSYQKKMIDQSQYKYKSLNSFNQTVFLIPSFSAVSSYKKNALFDNIRRSEMLRISDASRLENEANAIDEKIKKIQKRKI